MSLVIGTVYAALLAFGAARWRHAVMGVMILAVFEGAIRKWIFPEFHQWIYISKDILLLGAYLSFFGSRLVLKKRLFDRHPANGVLALFGLLAVLELANPGLPNILVGIFGLKAYLMYVPLMYMIPQVFPDARSLRTFWAGYLILSLIPLVLGPLQFAAAPNSVLNKYAWEDELAPGVALFAGAGKARVAGTFSYISGFAIYLVLVFLMALALVVFERRFWFRWTLYSLLGLALSNLVMTGSRGPLLTLGLAVTTLLLLTVWVKGPGRLRVASTLCVTIPLIALLVGSAFPEAQRAFLDRARENEDVPERIAGILYQPLWALREAGLFGYGIGSAHQAINFLVPGGIGEVSPPGAEGEWERIILEVGPFGFALVILARILVARHLWKALVTSENKAANPFLVSALLFSLLCLPGNLIYNHTAALFYWFLAGLALEPAGAERTRLPVSALMRAARRGQPGLEARSSE